MKVRRKKKPVPVVPTVETEIDTGVNDLSEMFAFTYEGVAYKTLLTKKWKERQPYTPPDLKKVYAFIPGTIISVAVKPGTKVKKGETLLRLKAMKMHNHIVATKDGTIKKVHVKPGEIVVRGQLLVELR